jgi:DNA polymerase
MVAHDLSVNRKGDERCERSFWTFETFYTKEYSLRKMTPVEYILDPRFETILCAVKEAWPNVGRPTQIIDGENFGDWVSGAGLEDACVVSHNALFDMCILSWRYNVRPRLMVDTLGVSRALLAHRLRFMSLAKVAEYLGLGAKGGEVANVIGMTRAEIKAAGLWPRYGQYSANDAELCAGIYDKLVRSGCFPVREIAVMDMVLRCATEPKFLLDQQAIAEHLAGVQRDKLELLASAMLAGAYNGKSDLMSNEKFANCLRSIGCEPPRKISPTTGLWTYAFAKTDKEFIALEEHPDPMVQVLVAARTGHKSTLEESRSERMLNIANLTWPGNPQKRMPIPLRYGGAHTGRLSGDWKLNLQNLRRGGKLRSALIAPPGHKVITVDASQIEARIVAWICNEHGLVQDFADGIDVYAKFASQVFNYFVSKSTHPNERFMGKTAILGLGYQVGGVKFQNTIEVQSQLQLGTKIEMSLDQATNVVNYYRHKYFSISGTWKRLQSIGLAVLNGSGNGFTLGPCEFEKHAIRLPNGLRLHYHGLRSDYTEEFGNEWTFEYAEERKKLYGGKILENVVQALARIHTMDAALRIQKRVRLAMQVHDELVYVVPDAYVDEVSTLVVEEMIRPPSWAPDLPLAADFGVGQSYGEAGENK